MLLGLFVVVLQGCVLQCLFLNVPPEHVLPPFSSCFWILLVLVLRPPPHVCVQDVHLPHCPHRQSTERGKHGHFRLIYSDPKFPIQISHLLIAYVASSKSQLFQVIPGQEFVLHRLSLDVSSKQLRPPFCSCFWILLVEVWIPPPHVCVQDAHLPHCPHWQSTERGKTWIL